MRCSTCPLSLTCLRGELLPEPCATCDRVLVRVPDDAHPKKRLVFYVIRCPIDGPTREYICDERVSPGCCPGCAPRLWQIAAGSFIAHILDPRDPETP